MEIVSNRSRYIKLSTILIPIISILIQQILTSTNRITIEKIVKKKSKDDVLPQYPTTEPIIYSENTIVVIGAGLAGLTATINSIDKALEKVPKLNRDKFKVILLEKENKQGGNSIKASSGINGVNTKGQEILYKSNNLKEKDSTEYFYKDTINSCKSNDKSQYNKSDNNGIYKYTNSLVQTLVDDSYKAINFLENHNVVPLRSIVQLGGHTKPRTHYPSVPNAPPVGAAIISGLNKQINDKTKKYNEYLLQFTNSEFIDISKIIQNNTIMYDIYYKTITSENKKEIKRIRTNIVIIATGGFGSNKDMIKQFAPDLGKQNLPTTNGPWAQGNSLTILKKLHVNLIGTDMIQVHPTGFIDPKDFYNPVKFLAPEALRGVGGILINLEGKRFVNELATRDIVSKSIYDQPGHIAFLLLSKESAFKFGLPALKFYKFKGFIKEIKINKDKDLSPIKDTIESLQNKDTKQNLSDLFQNNIHQELVKYKQGYQNKEDTHGKTIFPLAESYFIDTLYTSDIESKDYEECSFAVMIVTPAIHYTMGGIEIDKDGRVISSQELTGYLPNIYAIGEVSGGLHGNNRLGGNSLLECTVFGLRASDHAVNILFN